MKLAISGQQLAATMELEKIFIILKENDINAIELWPNNVPLTGLNVDFKASRYEGRDIGYVAELMKKYGMEISAVTLPGAFSKQFCMEKDEYARALKYAVEIAASLGATIVNHYCCNLAKDDSYDITSLQNIFEPALCKAQDLGITLSLENEAHDCTATPNGMLSLLQSINSRFFKTTFDPTNYYHAAQEGFPYAYETLKEHIAYVHIKNACVMHENIYSSVPTGQEINVCKDNNEVFYLPLGEGALNIDGLLNRLQGDGYNGYCTLEPHVKPEYIQRFYKNEIAYLRAKNIFKQISCV